MLRVLILVSLPVTLFMAFIFFGVVAGEHGDILAVVAATGLVAAYGFGMRNLVVAVNAGSQLLHKLFVAIWTYSTLMGLAFVLVMLVVKQNPFNLT